MRRALTLFAACLIASPSFAGGAAIGLMGAGGGSSSESEAPFSGAGDVVSGASFWWGLRAYTAAIADAATQPLLNLRRASDNHTCDIVVAGNGGFGNTASCSTGGDNGQSAASFAGTDATCTGTIASTTLTCVSASSTPHAGSTLSGTGINQPSYIVSCGTFTGGAGTCTLNATQTVSVGETITMTYALFATKLYDQTGNGNDIAQATSANQPQILPSCVSALPCLNGLIATDQYMTVTRAGGNIAEPVSFVSVTERTGSFTTGQNFVDFKSGGNDLACGWNNAANQAILYMTGFGSYVQAATDSAWHVFQCLWNGSASVFKIDGTNSANQNMFQNLPAYAATSILANTDGAVSMTGYWTEGGLWPSQLNPTQRTNMCRNANTYWVLGVTC